MFLKDHDIKLLKIDFNTDLTGIGTNGIGSVDLTGVNAGIGSTTIGFTTTTIAQFPKTDFNSLYATIFVQDSVTKEINYNEVIVCLLYTSPSPRDLDLSRMPSSA